MTYKIRYDGNGKCIGPAVYCDQCRKPIENEDMETSILTWRTSENMEGVKAVPAHYLHADCIIAYAEKHNKPYREWHGVKVPDLVNQKVTIYTVDPDRLYSNCEV